MPNQRPNGDDAPDYRRFPFHHAMHGQWAVRPEPRWRQLVEPVPETVP